MWRVLMPIFTIVLPVMLGMASVFLFIEGTISAATAIVVAFAMTAIAITAGLVQLGGDDDSTQGPESNLP